MRVGELASRDDFGALFSEMGFLMGVEVGVFRGDFSAQIMKAWKGRLFCVDAWRHMEGLRDITNPSDADHEANYLSARGKLEHLGAVPVRKTSLEAAVDFPAGSLDWVYLDADHRRKSVGADLEAWWPKVRGGGMMAGHDYVDDSDNPCGEFGVKGAVDEFFGKMGIVVWVTGEASWPSWYVVKP